jgi:1-acyl-sn-glycerol-3-phosphate acyltransferase
MLYQVVRSLVRVSLHFYHKRIGWEGVENIPANKPILFAPTHSNSFLDALFIASAFNRSVYCLARGDAFKKPSLNKLLRHFRLLPIFRQSENDINAATKNVRTFDECQELFRQNQWVLIFPEGICKNQKEVLPLKRGVTTMAQKAWAANIDVQIVPVSINYDSLSKWGKKCDIIFGEPLQNIDFQDINASDKHKHINQTLYARLSHNFPTPLKFEGKNLLWGWFGKMLYYIGWIINFPHYFLVKYLAKRATKGTVFYDSVVVGLLSQLLPFYYLFLGLVLYFLV